MKVQNAAWLFTAAGGVMSYRVPVDPESTFTDVVVVDEVGIEIRREQP